MNSFLMIISMINNLNITKIIERIKYLKTKFNIIFFFIYANKFDVHIRINSIIVIIKKLINI